MKKSWNLLLAVFLGGLLSSCSLNEQVFPIIGEPVQQDTVFDQLVPTIVDSMTLSLDGVLPDRRGLIFNCTPPQTLLSPSKLTLNLKAKARLELLCTRLTAGQLQVQAFLGPPEALWQNPLGDMILWNIASNEPLELDFSTELNTAQRDAVLGGNLALGFTVRSEPDLTIAPERSGATCIVQGADGNDYVRVRFRFLYEVPELSLTATLF